MYLSPDTPMAVKEIQQQIWLSKSIEERLRLSAQMIDDAIALQIHGIRMRHPDWTEQQIRHYRLRRMMKTDPSLTWLEGIIGKETDEEFAKRSVSPFFNTLLTRNRALKSA